MHLTMSRSVVLSICLQIDLLIKGNVEQSRMIYIQCNEMVTDSVTLKGMQYDKDFGFTALFSLFFLPRLTDCHIWVFKIVTRAPNLIGQQIHS